MARAAKSHAVAERLPSIIEGFRNIRANVLPVTKETLAKRLWARGENATAIGVLFQDASATELAPARGKFVAMRDELFRVVKPGLPDLVKLDLNADLNAWRVRQRAGGNLRHDLEEMIDNLPWDARKWGRFPPERVYNVDRAPPPPPLPPRATPHHTAPAPHPHHTPHHTHTAPEASAPYRGTPAVRRRLRPDVRGHRREARVGAAVLVGLAREAVCVGHCTLSVGV